MTTPELFLAAALIAGLPDSPIPKISPEDWPAFQEAVTQHAIENQLLDRREAQFLFVKPEELKNDMNVLRRRHQELSDAPRLEECDRLPRRDEVNQMLSFNRGYRTQLEARQITEPHWGDYHREAMRETDKLYQVWDSVRDARCEFYYTAVRRQALKRVKEMVGPGEFEAGILPPCVPTWRFAEVK
jgi:hypothetical protein